MIYVLDDVTSPEFNKDLEEYFDNTELESIEATVDYFKPESYHFSKYEKDIPCHTNIFEDFSPVVEKFAPVIRAMIPIVGDVSIVASRFNLVDNSKSQNHTPFHRDFRDEHWVGIYYLNDADGSTIVYDEGDAKYTEPKRDRLLFFPGQFHAVDLSKDIIQRKIYNFAFTLKNP